MIPQRLAGKRICIVAGSGGVGKTTTSAAIAMGLAARGERVAVVTIDPAKRLANALGIDELGNEPRLVDPAVFAAAGLDMRGELWALMLDPKRTFDDLITRLSPDPATRDEILGNRIYQEFSSAVAGSQEFTAIAKLYELDRDGGFDVIVLDTPPSRNALDFLDAPDRISGFIEGRALRLFFAPTGLAARVMGRSTGVVFGLLKRLTGVDLLEDLGVFFRALSGVLDGFTERAHGVARLLDDPGTTFLVVTSPQRHALEEAIFFHGKLREAHMPFGGLIVNRVVPWDGDPDAEDEATDARLRADLEPRLGTALAGKVTRAHAETRLLARRDRRTIARVRDELAIDDPLLVPQIDGDVHDVGGLVGVHAHLFGTA